MHLKGFFLKNILLSVLCLLCSGLLWANANAQNLQKLVYTGIHEIIISPGSVFTISIEGNKKDVAAITTLQEDNTLIIKDKAGHIFRDKLRILITLGNISEFHLSGDAILLNDATLTEGFKLILMGKASANLQVEIANGEISAILGENALLQLAGQAPKLKAMMKGSSLLRAKNLTVKEAEVTQAGKLEAEVRVTEILHATVTGPGSILYSGNPHVHPENTGTGSIRQQ